MLRGTCWAIQTIRSSGEQDLRWWALQNALIESFVVHARALLDFLYGPAKLQPDDVVADDYVDAAMWATSRPQESASLEGVRSRAGKEIAHLTYKRLERTDKKNWDFARIAADIGSLLDKFVTLVPVSNMPDNVRSDIVKAARGLVASGPVACTSTSAAAVISTSSVEQTSVVLIDPTGTQSWSPEGR